VSGVGLIVTPSPESSEAVVYPSGNITTSGIETDTRQITLSKMTASERKKTPICTGVLDYFPDALAEVARVSMAGNKQHQTGDTLVWDRTKSTDHADSAVRHIMDRGRIDSDGRRHSAKAAWRLLALLQEEIENDNGKE
jgi:hypothetical protein